MKEFNYSLLLPFISFTTDSFIIIFFHYGLRISNHIYTDKYGYLPPIYVWVFTVNCLV